MKTNILIITNKLHLLIIFLLIEFVLAPISLYAKDFIIISEVMYDSPLNEQIATGIAYSNGEFIELYNAGTEWTSLNGWSLKGGGSTEIYQFPANTVLAPNSYLIVAYQYNNSSFTLDQLYTGFTTSPDHQVQYQRKIILSNSGEALKLISVSGNTKDSLYIDGTINKTKPYRLSAANTDSIAGNSCVSLQRTTATFDITGVAITNNQEWTTALVNPFIQYITHNISTISNIPASSNYGTITVSNGQNYIQSRTYTAKNAGAFLDQIQYFDGLGRSIQTVQKGITPGTTHSDLATYTEYDNAGRESKQWLPIVSSGGGFVNYSSFTSGSSLYNNDQHAYTETHYEASPLNRVDWQQGPGSAWQGHPVSTAYETNLSTEVKYFIVSGTSLFYRGQYDPASLYKTTVTDEDGNPTTEYKDKQGRVVMKRGFTDEAGNHDTYYVYNDLGQLCFVLPPLAADASGSPDAINKYGYVYHYDERGNCTYKKLPGCEPINMTYYTNNLLKTSQDGNQLAKNEKLSYVYDGLNRLVTTSLESNSNSTVLTENYYDNYNFISNSNLSFVPREGYDSQHSSAKGLMTGTKTYSLNDVGDFTTTALYYDYKGNVIQTRSTNYLGGYDLVYNNYNFIGKVIRSEQVHSVADDYPPGNADFSFTENTEIYVYDYDHAGRLTNTYRNGQIYTSQKYNDLGQLIEKKTLNGIDTTSYTYNIRGWLNDINGTHFYQHLYYNDPIAGANACYNGNISAMKWKSYGETKMRGYTLEYDDLNRLLNANYGEGDNLQTATGRFDEKLTYDKMGNIISLKREGVGSKNYNSYNYRLIDDLEYGTYNGNQQTSVNDHAEEVEPVIFEGVADFKDRSNASKQYFYDANGNLTKDLNKGIDTIQYNLLNLPQEIVFANGDRSLYKYNAAGKKYQVIYYTHIDNELNPIQGNGVAMYDTLTYDYDGSYVYRDHYFNMLMTPDGYVHISDITPLNCFYAKDHLGNNRATYYVTPMAELGVLVKDINNYYPYGMEFNEKPAVVYAGFNPELDFTYNGKEFQTMHGLNMLDYGARFIDMSKPDWIGVDPLAEKYYSISPYAYCAGNPVRFIDPNGEEIWIYYTDNSGNEQKIQYTQGAEYKGNDTFVSNTFSYLNSINNNGGSDMLNTLSSSKNSFDFINQPTTDKKGNTIDGAINFDGNQSGGGTIYAGALMGNTSEYSKIESTSHELFHGLQHEQGQGGASVYNEVEANVYSSNITSNWSYNTNYFGGMSANGLGNSTPAGVLYQQSFDNLTKSFSNPDFVNAVRSFQAGSEKNASGLYNGYPLQRSNQTRSILQQFYPKRL